MASTIRMIVSLAWRMHHVHRRQRQSSPASARLMKPWATMAIARSVRQAHPQGRRGAAHEVSKFSPPGDQRVVAIGFHAASARPLSPISA
jgi:hypothetical protein